MNQNEARRVLLATSSELLRARIGEPLRDEGYEVEELNSSLQVLDRLKDLSEGVLIMGRHLDDGEALPFLNQLDEPKIPIIMIGVDRRRERDYRKCGVRFFLYPPFFPEMVNMKLKVVFDPKEERGLGQMRHHDRICVENLKIELIRPIKELVNVADLGLGGAKITANNLEQRYVGRLLKMQLVYGQKTFSINGRLIWCEDGMAGIHFMAPKPLGFSEFFNDMASGL